MEIRTASLQDLEDIAAVEAACFPGAEAATKAEFAERIQHYGDHFSCCMKSKSCLRLWMVLLRRAEF